MAQCRNNHRSQVNIVPFSCQSRAIMEHERKNSQHQVFSHSILKVISKVLHVKLWLMSFFSASAIFVLIMCQYIPLLSLEFVQNSKKKKVKGPTLPELATHTKHLTACVYTVLDRKLTLLWFSLLHLSREEEFDEYFEDMFLWLLLSAATLLWQHFPLRTADIKHVPFWVCL